MTVKVTVIETNKTEKTARASNAATSKPSSSGSALIDDAVDGGVVGEGLKRRPSRSAGEAHGKMVAMARASVPGLGFRRKSFVNRWKKQMWDPAFQLRINIVCARLGVSPSKFKDFLMLLSTYTSWDGKDPVFVLRATLAARLPGNSTITGGAGLRVVDRCLQAAEDLGFISEGFQQIWVQTLDDGREEYKASSSCRMLLMPNLGPTAAELRYQEQVAAVRARTAEAYEAAEQAKQEARRRHREAMDELYGTTPAAQKPPQGRGPGSGTARSAEMTEALRAARHALE